MTQAFDEAGLLTPVTVLEVVPCPIVQIKDRDSDGYTALRVAYHKTRANRSTAQIKVFSKRSASPSIGALRKFALIMSRNILTGEALDVGMFEVGEVVDVTGRSKLVADSKAVSNAMDSGAVPKHMDNLTGIARRVR